MEDKIMLARSTGRNGKKAWHVQGGGMDSGEAGRLNGAFRKSFDQESTDCLHQRMVSYQVDAEGKSTGHLVCRECCAVIPDPLKNLG
jgi:hypothetical protein